MKKWWSIDRNRSNSPVIPDLIGNLDPPIKLEDDKVGKLEAIGSEAEPQAQVFDSEDFGGELSRTVAQTRGARRDDKEC